MELRLVEAKADKLVAQRKLERLVEESWKGQETRVVTWRPSQRSLSVCHSKNYWFAAIENRSKGRYWNSIGAYAANGALQIAVEVNVSIRSNERTVSGFFAKDERTGVLYLMHDGAVGGGRKGVNRAGFLCWTRERLFPVIDSSGQIRLGIIVTALKSGVIGGRLGEFAQKVLGFKQAVREGKVQQRTSKEFEDSLEAYQREFSGKKKRQRMLEMEYITRHGDIVDALQEWRSARAERGERIVNTMLMDLGVKASGQLTEVYEVKTSTDRQALYTAIGQLLVHDAGAPDYSAQRYLVVPKDGRLPSDVTRTLQREQIRVLRFDLKAKAVQIHE